MYKPDPKTSLLEHSEAKIKLYGKYLEVYLIILHRASFVKKVFIFDLFCGEGIYENGAKGSPIIALETIKDHYFANGQQITDITIWFNDNGMSEIEPEKLKIDRVSEASSTIFCPGNLEVKYHKEDYKLIYPKAIQAVQSTRMLKDFSLLTHLVINQSSQMILRKCLQVGKMKYCFGYQLLKCTVLPNL